MDDLIRKITKDLGVSRDQARGGVVALLRAGQQNLSPTDFKLLKNAPPPSALSSLAGGIGSLFGGRNSATGRWAGLAASFAELGVDIDTAKKFGPIVIEHVRQHGGEDLVDKIRVALKV
jgi:Protein of unknown function VcgC/VcgE (DUF2780)